MANDDELHAATALLTIEPVTAAQVSHPSLPLSGGGSAAATARMAVVSGVTGATYG